MSDQPAPVAGATVIAVPLRRVLGIGALAGFVPGFIVGCLLGGVVAWAAGAVVNWMQQVSFTTGMRVALMPLGNQVNALQSTHDSWYLVVPVIGLVLGVLTAAIGALTAVIVAVMLPGRVGGPDIALRIARRQARRHR
ncbi:MAG: hypothetical protein ACRDOD_08200 [Streptosporangiaceae bacterium]